MIRNRWSKSVPGGKRPWLIESDEVSHPADVDAAGVGRLDGGVRWEPAARARSGDTRATCSVAEMVIASLPDGWPQAGQNRASCGISAAQSPQRTREFYAKRRDESGGDLSIRMLKLSSPRMASLQLATRTETRWLCTSRESNDFSSTTERLYPADVTRTRASSMEH
jgi:hypothetical protein